MSLRLPKFPEGGWEAGFEASELTGVVVQSPRRTLSADSAMLAELLRLYRTKDSVTAPSIDRRRRLVTTLRSSRILPGQL